MGKNLDESFAPRLATPGMKTVDHTAMRSGSGIPRKNTEENDDAWTYGDVTEESDQQVAIETIVEQNLMDTDRPSAIAKRCRNAFQKLTGFDPAGSGAPWRSSSVDRDGKRIETDEEARCIDMLLASVERLVEENPRSRTTDGLMRKYHAILKQLLEEQSRLAVAGEATTEAPKKISARKNSPKEEQRTKKKAAKTSGRRALAQS